MELMAMASYDFIIDEIFNRIVDVIKDDFDANSMYGFLDDDDFESDIKNKIKEAISIVVEELVENGDIIVND